MKFLSWLYGVLASPLVVYRVSVVNQMLHVGGWYPIFHSGRLCPEMQSHFIAFINLVTNCNAICFKQETGTLHCKHVHIDNQRASRLFGCKYTCTTVRHVASKRKSDFIRIKTDDLAY